MITEVSGNFAALLLSPRAKPSAAARSLRSVDSWNRNLPTRLAAAAEQFRESVVKMYGALFQKTI